MTERRARPLASDKTKGRAGPPLRYPNPYAYVCLMRLWRFPARQTGAGQGWEAGPMRLVERRSPALSFVKDHSTIGTVLAGDSVDPNPGLRSRGGVTRHSQIQDSLWENVPPWVCRASPAMQFWANSLSSGGKPGWPKSGGGGIPIVLQRANSLQDPSGCI